MVFVDEYMKYYSCGKKNDRIKKRRNFSFYFLRIENTNVWKIRRLE